MTQRRLDEAVAAITGESLAIVRSLGFSTAFPPPHNPDPNLEDLHFVLDCPFCGLAIPYPGLVDGGLTPLAECLICDVYFDFALDEVYALARVASEARNDVGSIA